MTAFRSATFLLGDVSVLNRYVSNSTNASESQPRFFLYGQDEWRVTPKLTVDWWSSLGNGMPRIGECHGQRLTLNLSNGLMYVFGYELSCGHTEFRKWTGKLCPPSWICLSNRFQNRYSRRRRHRL